MHIAFMIGSFAKGGSERVMSNLIDYFARREHQVTVITQYCKEDEYELNPKARRILSDIAPEEVTGSRIRNFYRRFRKLRNIWKTERPDLILVFIGKNNIMTLLTSWGLHIPVVVSVRAEPHEEYPNRWMRFAARHLFRRATGVVVQTSECKRFFPEKIQEKTVILLNPINASFFGVTYEGEREHTIVTVGRMDENKNQQLLIRAFAKIADQYPEYQLILYGKGEKEEALRTLTRELRLEDRIEFPGVINDVPEKIKKAGVFVLPSYTEGMPNALIEAMIIGLPVISTDCPCGGSADLIDHGINGLLTPVGDADKMAENLQVMLNDLQKASEMGKKARETADIYREETVYGEWYRYLLGVYEEYSKSKGI